MARKSSSDNNDDILMKGISNANSSINEVSEKVGQSQKELKKLNTKTDKIAKSTESAAKNTDKAAMELKGIRSSVDKGTARIEKKLSDLTKAVEKIGTAGGGNGAPVQNPVNMSPASGTKTSSSTALVPVGGSKIMGTVPSVSMPKSPSGTQQLPGKQILGLPGPTNAAANSAQKRGPINAIKQVGSNILGFFGSKSFWGKMVGAVKDGLIASKLFGNTLGDLIKLGVFLVANFVRNFFGKKWGGITAILLTMAASMIGFKQIARIFKGIPAIFKGLGAAWKWGTSFFTKGKVAKSTALVPYDPTKKLPKNIALWKSASGKSGAVLRMSKPVATAVNAATKVAQNPFVKGAGKVAPWLAAGMGVYGMAKSALHKDWIGAGGHALAAALPAIGGWAGGLLGGTGGTFAIPGVGTVSGATLGTAAGTGIGVAGSVAIENWLSKREKGKAQSSATPDVPGSKIQKDVSLIAKVVSFISEVLKKIGNFFTQGPFSGAKNFFKMISNLFGGGSNGGSAGPVGKQDKIQNKLNEVLYGKDTMKGFDSHQVTSNYGWRIHPTKGGSRFHHGVDLGYSEGEQVQAKLGGKIIAAQSFDGYGNTVIVDSGDAYELYGHLSEFGSGISAGKKISKNAVIGLAGHTGEGTGAHLHYEVRKKANAKTAGSIQNFFASKDVNPIKFTTEKQKAEAKSAVPTAKPKDTPATKDADRSTDTKKVPDYMGDAMKQFTPNKPADKTQGSSQKISYNPVNDADIARYATIGGGLSIGGIMAWNSVSTLS